MKIWQTALATVVGCTLAAVSGRSGPGQPGRAGLRAETMRSPAPPGSLVPQLTATAGGDLILTWMEPLAGGGYTFRMSTLHAGKWSEPATIARDPGMSMFSADLPGVAEMPGGGLLAYWELSDKVPGDSVATAMQIALSADGGKNWSAPRRPYPDTVSVQHSFISVFPAGGQLGLAWLDAQQRRVVSAAAAGDHAEHNMTRMGAVGLRWVAVDAAGDIKADSFIDPIACECCPTGAALTTKGPVVVYRGRQEPAGAKPAEVSGSEATIRDIQITRLSNGRWTKPHRIYADNWTVNACPDNGPAVDSVGDQVAVAWWTRAGDHPKVELAFSSDAGDAFSDPVRVDQGAGEGQVSVAWVAARQVAVVGWLEDQKVWARWFSPDGKSGKPVLLGISPHHVRLPKWIVQDDNVIAAWTQQLESRSVQVSRLRFTGR